MRLTTNACGADWEARINYDRMREERLAKVQEAIAKHGVDGLLLFKPENSRYTVGAIGMHVAWWICEYALVPQKTLAVRVGLAEYGRNNITYVSSMGSFHRPSTFYSDFPFEEDNWQELRKMDLCEECLACVRNCPTGAIPTDRFLLRVERCITYHNEQPEGVPFPEWLDSSWHNCLVGCLHCQKICPANKKVKDWIEPGPIFTEEETKLLLNGRTIDNLPTETKKKMEDIDFVNYLGVFPRNLSVFLKND